MQTSPYWGSGWRGQYCQQTEFRGYFLPRNASEQNSESSFRFSFHGTEFRAVFFSGKCSGIKILKVCVYFCSTETEVQSVFSSAKCSGTKFRKFASISVQRYETPTFFSPAECFSIDFRGGTAGIPSEITNCFVYSVFRGIIFFGKC